MAITPSPTLALDESPKLSGCSLAPSTPFTRITATSADASCPTMPALALEPSANFTSIELAPSTTCSLVTMSPFLSTTMPEPSPVVSAAPNGPAWACDWTVMSRPGSAGKGQGARVEGAAVELDHEALRSPDEVALVARHDDVDLGLREA